MLIHFDASLLGVPLSEAQSRAFLRFCCRAGAAVFTVNFLYVKGKDSERVSAAFFQRLSSFSAGEWDLENIYGGGFRRQECWALSDESIEMILRETAGNLFAYDVLHLPEDWLVYVDDVILLQVVSHEQEATLRLSETQYAEFTKLGIPHKAGPAQWSALPESPQRTNPAS